MARVSEEASAAFGRLRVETPKIIVIIDMVMSAAFGRLRVETAIMAETMQKRGIQPPSGGCVLKQTFQQNYYPSWESAAFGRLRVETTKLELSEFEYDVSRLRAAAC